MPNKLNEEQRFAAVARVLVNHEKVTSVCRQYSVSRTLFYRWMQRYKKALMPRVRAEIIRRIEAGEPVSAVCLEFKISRTVYYKWLKRYKSISSGEKIAVLCDKPRTISRYFNQVSAENEKEILAIVRQYPELSLHKIVDALPLKWGRPVVGYHGVQNTLRRNGLSKFEQRWKYMLDNSPVTVAN